MAFKSNNGIERYKYITFGLPAKGAMEARPRLGRVEADVMGNLKRLGVQSHPLDGRDRLAVLHGQMHPGGREPFRFAWKDIPKTGILLRDPLTASYFVAVWKMLRKKGCVPSALTQNVKDLLASREIENILDNTDFMVLLSQAQSDRAILAKQLGISEHQLSYITHSNSGEGFRFRPICSPTITPISAVCASALRS